MLEGIGDLARHARQRGPHAGLGRSEREAGTRLDVHQRGKLESCDRQLTLQFAQHTHDLDQFAAIRNGRDRGGRPVVGKGSRCGERGPGARFQPLHFGSELLGGPGAPVGGAHVFHQAVDNLATGLFCHQRLVGGLAGANDAEAEIENVPAECQVGRANALVLGRREAEVRRFRHEVEARRRVWLVAGGIARVGNEVRQQVVVGQVEFGDAQGRLVSFDLMVEVVLEGTRHSLMQVD